MPRGGRRPGAGAPKGNMNAMKHGKHSARVRFALDVLQHDPEFQDLMEWAQRRTLQERKSYIRALAVIEHNPAPTAADIIARRFPANVAREFNILPHQVAKRIEDLRSAKIALRKVRARFARNQHRREFPPFRSLLDEFNQSPPPVSREEQSTNDSAPDFNQFWH